MDQPIAGVIAAPLFKDETILIHETIKTSCNMVYSNAVFDGERFDNVPEKQLALVNFQHINY